MTFTTPPTTNTRYAVGNFVAMNPFEKRQLISRQIEQKYPGHVAIVVEEPRNTSESILTKSRFIAGKSVEWRKCLMEIRKQTSLNQYEAVYVFIDNIIPSSTDTVESIYTKHKLDDGILYAVITKEDTFGSHRLS